MKMDKAARTSEVPIVIIRISVLESTLVRNVNSMVYGDRMLKSRRKIILIPFYNCKDDAKECSNYRSLKMLEHAMKIMEIAFERKIRGAITINDIQMRFMPGKTQITPYLL